MGFLDIGLRVSGIYEIRNSINGKRYIGSAVCLRNRAKKHLHDLRYGYHHSAKLQRAWNKYGESAFTFKILELVVPTKLIEREQFWFDLSNAAGEDRYNISHVAGHALGQRRSEESKQRMS